MRPREPLPFGPVLSIRLKNFHRIAVVGIGDELSPLDRSGMYAAGEIEKMHIPNIRVFLAGTVPESITGILRAYRPDHVIFLDAADMGVPPGSFRVIEPSCTQANLVSSHVLPLTVVIEFITNDTGSSVTLLGIQPDITRPYRDLSRPGQELFRRNLSTLVEILQSCR